MDLKNDRKFFGKNFGKRKELHKKNLLKCYMYLEEPYHVGKQELICRILVY